MTIRHESKSPKRLAKKLVSYSFAAGASALISGEATAVPVSFPVPSPGSWTADELAMNPLEIDLNQDSFTDFRIAGGFNGRFDIFTEFDFSFYAGGLGIHTTGFDSYGANLSAGSVVGPMTSFEGSARIQSPYGAFAFFNNRGFLGLEVTPDNYDSHYGYLEIEVNPPPIEGGDTTLSIYSGAYESTAFAPITVPEPSGALAMLAAGAAGLGTLRRRK